MGEENVFVPFAFGRFVAGRSNGCGGEGQVRTGEDGRGGGLARCMMSVYFCVRLCVRTVHRVQ